jgi:hypothetical protein
MLDLKLYHCDLGTDRHTLFNFFVVKSNLFITSKHLSAYL